jgi:hypothetical protein
MKSFSFRKRFGLSNKKNMDWYGTEVVINEEFKYIDDDFTKEWNENIWVQAWISALESIYGTKDRSSHDIPILKTK